MSKVNKAVLQTLANTEQSIYERVDGILATGGSIEDVQAYCKLLEHSIKNVREHLDQDQAIANIGDNINCANFAVENADYNACVRALLLCINLIPNPMQRDDLRLRYYPKILTPEAGYDYGIMLVALENTVIKLNGGKVYVPPSAETEKVSKWKTWFPTLSTN